MIPEAAPAGVDTIEPISIAGRATAGLARRTRELNTPATRCNFASALGPIEGRWSLLILAAALDGAHHFEEYQGRLGIARNILADRLSLLVRHGVLERRHVSGDRRKIRYVLTEKGEALRPAVAALRSWCDNWGLEGE